MSYNRTTPTCSPHLSPLAALLLAMLGSGCIIDPSAGEATGEIELESRGGGGGKPSRGDTTQVVSCTTEPSTPSARGAVVVDGDPARATSVRVEIANASDVPRLIAARVRAEVGGQRRTAEHPALYIRPGAATSETFDLGELRIDGATAELPARISAALIVTEEDGSFVERITLDGVDVGPTIDDALAALLAGRRIKSRDLASTGLKGLTATIVSADRGDTGLFPDQLDDPDDDGGVPTIPPNYSDAVPDENGLYHHDFCLRWPVAFDDAGFGEDYGVEPEAAWKARGGKVKIMSHDQTLFDGFLDFDGCTGVIDSPYHSDFWLIGYSVAEMAGNTVIARREDGNTEAWLRLVDEVGGSGTKYYTLAPGTVDNLLAVPVFTLARFGTVSGASFDVHDRCRPDGDQCCNCAIGDQIYIDSTQRKFLIGHEMGHAILAATTGGFVNDCTMTSSANLPCSTTSDHAIDSVETASCAAMEGWAHFVAVRTFNNHLEGDDPGAVLQYWRGTGLTVDVEQGPAGGVDQYYETQCGFGPGNSDGKGVELDWLRAWWDYHTDPAPGFEPTPSVLVDEIASNSNWTNVNTYQVLTDNIEAADGAAQRDRWTQIAADNGIDH